MMSVPKVLLLVMFSCCVLLTNYGVVSLGNDDASDGTSLLSKLTKDTDSQLIDNRNNNDMLLLDDYQSLLTAIRRGLLAEAILKEKLNEQEQEEEESDEQESLVNRRALEKRFPKWRSGETRSRVKLLHQNHNNDYFNLNNYDHHHQPNNDLRKQWEQNMLEKNKMYQKLLGPQH